MFAGDQHGQGWLLLHAPPPSSASSAASHFLNEGVTKLAPKNVRFIHARGPQCTPARCIRPHGTQADGTTCVSPAAFPKFGWQPGSNRSSRESSPELDLQSPLGMYAEPSLTPAAVPAPVPEGTPDDVDREPIPDPFCLDPEPGEEGAGAPVRHACTCLGLGLTPPAFSRQFFSFFHRKTLRISIPLAHQPGCSPTSLLSRPTDLLRR